MGPIAEMSDMNANGVTTEPAPTPSATKPKPAKLPKRTVASSVENPARKFGLPERTEKPKKLKTAGKKGTKKASTSGKKKAKATSKAQHASRSGAKSKPKKKTHVSAASSKPASAPKKKHVKQASSKRKIPRHWTDDNAQLVLHAKRKTVEKFDRKLQEIGKRLKLQVRVTRGSVIRALVEREIER